MLGCEEAVFLFEALAPSGSIMQALLQYVWSLWEDPIDVSMNYDPLPEQECFSEDKNPPLKPSHPSKFDFW